MQPLVVRPSGRKQLSFLFRAGALLVFGAIAVWALVLVVAGSYAVLGWSILALLLLLALSQLVRQRVDQLFVDGDTFGNVTTLGRRRTFSRASLTRVDRVTLVNPQARPEAFLVFVGPDGRALFRTPDLLWSDHDLAPLWDRLGKAPSPDRMLTNAAYGVAYLHLRPWSATDSLIVAAFVIGGALVSGVIGAKLLPSILPASPGLTALLWGIFLPCVALSSWAAAAIVRRRRRLPESAPAAAAVLGAAERKRRYVMYILMPIGPLAGLVVAALGIYGVATHARYAAAPVCATGVSQSACRRVTDAEVTTIDDEGSTDHVTFTAPIPDADMDSSAAAQLTLQAGEQVRVELWNGSVTSVATDQGTRQTYATEPGRWIEVGSGLGLLVFSVAVIANVNLLRRRRRVAEQLLRT